MTDYIMQEAMNNWLDTMMQIYGSILDTWMEYGVVTPNTPTDKQNIKFECNNCGKCCSFEEHWVWVYPSDIVSWIKDIDKEKFIPLMLGTLFPTQDNEDLLGFCLPTQQILWDKFNLFIKKNKKFQKIQNTLRTLLDYIQEFNPSFNKKSNKCIFYDSSQANHCLIYDYRPIQCKSYPYDFPQFCNLEIPEELQDTYALTEENEDEELPLCPKSCYTGTGEPKKGIIINDEQINNVYLEKCNYLASSYAQTIIDEETSEALIDFDISEALLELFYEDIQNLLKKIVIKKDNKTGGHHKFVKGERK